MASAFVTEVPGQDADSNSSEADELVPYDIARVHLAPRLAAGAVPSAQLPHGVQARTLLERALRRTKAGLPHVVASCPGFAELVLSEPSQKLVSCAFWWAALQRFGGDMRRDAIRGRESNSMLHDTDGPPPWSPSETDTEQLFREMALGYGELFTRSMLTQTAAGRKSGAAAATVRNCLLSHFPDVVAQAVHRGLVGCFRAHRDLRDIDYRRELARHLHVWISGVAPSVLHVGHWLADEDRREAARAQKQEPPPVPQQLQQRLQKYDAVHSGEHPSRLAAAVHGVRPSLFERQHSAFVKMVTAATQQQQPPKREKTEPAAIIPKRGTREESGRWWEAGRRTGRVVADVDGNQTEPAAVGKDGRGSIQSFVPVARSPFVELYLAEKGMPQPVSHGGRVAPRLSWWHASAVELSGREVLYAPLGAPATTCAKGALQEQRAWQGRLERQAQRDRRALSAVQTDLERKARQGHKSIGMQASAGNKLQRSLISELRRQAEAALGAKDSDPSEIERKLNAALEVHDDITAQLHPRNRSSVLKYAVRMRHKLSYVRMMNAPEAVAEVPGVDSAWLQVQIEEIQGVDSGVLGEAPASSEAAPEAGGTPPVGVEGATSAEAESTPAVDVPLEPSPEALPVATRQPSSVARQPSVLRRQSTAGLPMHVTAALSHPSTVQLTRTSFAEPLSPIPGVGSVNAPTAGVLSAALQRSADGHLSAQPVSRQNTTSTRPRGSWVAETTAGSTRVSVIGIAEAVQAAFDTPSVHGLPALVQAQPVRTEPDGESLPSSAAADSMLDRLRLPELTVHSPHPPAQALSVARRRPPRMSNPPTPPLPAVPARLVAVARRQYGAEEEEEEHIPAWRNDAAYIKGLQPCAGEPCGSWPVTDEVVPQPPAVKDGGSLNASAPRRARLLGPRSPPKVPDQDRRSYRSVRRVVKKRLSLLNPAGLEPLPC
eukprot:TRINITY_DN1512_c1_g1_i1.p1 TRINITY_DN1512_c1_g1~~TRINITY_DN1512_c1_g1_i1.p1  ORF type:complete len:987 (+),score=298.58 TRINITY_DN1512_c1_g1_i1:132-2963(+)